MKTRTITQFVSAAVGVILPVVVWAQDLGSDLSNGGPGTSAANSGNIQSSNGIGSGNNGSYSSGAILSGNSSQSSANQPGTFSGGIMVQDGAAYVVHRLQNEMSLPDGSKIEPNGTIHQSDGSTRSIGTGQILTMDGRVMSAPFSSGSAQSNSSSGSSGLYNSGNTPGASTSSGPSSLPGSQGSQSSTPPTTSNSSQGLGGSSPTFTPDSNSSSLNNGSTNPTPADQSDGSGLAPGATSTDPAEDFTD